MVQTSFFIPFRDNKTKLYNLKVMSDFWIDAEFHDQIDLSDIVMNNESGGFTELLDLQPLPTSVLNNEGYAGLYNFKFFNPI